MAPDDRNFEKALTRHLRSEAAVGQPSSCADAETLAAYHERLLAPNELSSWKKHVTGCARCQAILAQLEATDEISVGSTAQEEAGKRVLVMTGRESAVMSPAPAATTAQSVPALAAKSPSKTRRSPLANWRYLVPVGAIAASLLIFVVSREGNLQRNILQPTPTPASPQPSAYSAASSPNANASAKQDVGNKPTKTQSEPKVALAVPRQPASAPPDGLREASGGSAGVLAGRVDQNERDHALSDLGKEETFKDARRSSSAMGHSTQAQQQQSSNAIQQEPSLDELRKQQRSSADLKQDAPAFDDSDKFATPPPPAKARALARYGPTAPAPAPPAPPVSAAGAVVGGVTGKKARNEKENAEVASVPAATETVVVTGEANAVLATAMTTAGPRVLPVPGSRIIWKIDEAGHVQRTADLGATWRIQDIGVNATLLSGSAPSEKVCWLVGTFGTVFLTTDSGAHWSKLTVPINSTIDRIEATDARHAVITLQSTTVQFETFDGGQTWSLAKKK